MSHERRAHKRVPCRIPAAAPKGPAVIRDVSATGARVVTAAAPRLGERLPLRLYKAGGRYFELHGAVRRVRSRERGGYDVGCSFESHPESSVAAWRMAKSLAAGPMDFVAPPAPTRRVKRSKSWGDYFTIEGLLFLAVGVAMLGIGSVVAWGYFGMR